MDVQSAKKALRRIELIDVARGAALIAMAIYHFTWDLDFFGYLEPGISGRGGWKIFARSIATSFLFLVGFSLFLAHGERIRGRSFAKRLAVIAAAAAAITLVTYFATPDAFIFFGILHHIAVASALGLLFLKLPAALILAAAAAAIAVPFFLHAPFLDQQAFWWTGLARNVPATNDFVPLFPWFGAVLIGIAAAKLAQRTDLLARMGEWRPARRLPLVAAAGRHSLAFYLLHQPVLVAIVWLFSLAVPPAAFDPGTLFLQACSDQCVAQQDERFCRPYCTCILDAAAGAGRLDALFDPRRGEEAQTWLEDVAFRCSVENNG